MLSPDDRVKQRVDADGTITVRTNDNDPYSNERRARQDAELQATLDVWRARGVPRPVLFVRDNLLSEETARSWRQLEPALKELGISTFSSYSDDCRHYLVTPDAACKLLRDLTGLDTSQYFRQPMFPLSYWIVGVIPGGVSLAEGRTAKDDAAAEQKA
jgi:hypothetical protein